VLQTRVPGASRGRPAVARGLPSSNPGVRR
jgi:hypothetical protein